MEFVRELHTKKYLSENKNILEVLAKSSADFAVSYLAEDIDFLKTKVHGQSVAHILAINQSSWLASSASKNFEVLSLRDSFEITVAHYLAQYQSDWALSESAENIDVLMLRGNSQLTVAHVLAQHQQDWLKSSASKNVNILKLMDKDKWTVAQFLVGFNLNSFNGKTRNSHFKSLI